MKTEEKAFMDKQMKPTEQDLQAALGAVYKQYEQLNELTSAYKKQWTFTKSSGWLLKVFDAKKALFYLSPLKNEFRISMAIRETERDALLQEDCLNAYHEELQSAKKYAEGYAVRFLISGTADFAGVEAFVNMLMHLRK